VPLYLDTFYSRFYRDALHWKLKESKIYEKWLIESQWGRLFKEYGETGATRAWLKKRRCFALWSDTFEPLSFIDSPLPLCQHIANMPKSSATLTIRCFNHQLGLPNAL
jgi:hypothetical protein